MNILIVDDEKPARDRMRQLLDDFPEHKAIGAAKNGAQALQMCHELNPDVVLLDIRMPGLNGIETAHHLNQLESPPAVVFTTAYDEYAIEAFDARAIGYVLKPVRRERLARALQQASRMARRDLSELSTDRGLNAQRQHVCARVQDELKLIRLDDVYFFRADQKYTCVHHVGGQLLIDDPLKSLEQEFSDHFVRIHRNALVAIKRIDCLQRCADGSYRVALRGGSHADDINLVISRRHLTEVRRRLKGKHS